MPVQRFREAIAPWDEVKRDCTAGQKLIPKKSKQQPLPAPLPEGEVELVRLPEPPEHPSKRQRRQNTEIEYPYSDTQWVVRTDKPDGSKTVIPYHLDKRKNQQKGKGDHHWSLYRLDEVKQYGLGKWVLGVEGEKATEAARSLQLVAVTGQGADWKDTSKIESGLRQLQKMGVEVFVYWRDFDEAGKKIADMISNAAAKIGLPCLIPDPSTFGAKC
jgi:hypothetical protein